MTQTPTIKKSGIRTPPCLAQTQKTTQTKRPNQKGAAAGAPASKKRRGPVKKTTKIYNHSLGLQKTKFLIQKTIFYL
jgi:hypothetical protein